MSAQAYELVIDPEVLSVVALWRFIALESATSHAIDAFSRSVHHFSEDQAHRMRQLGEEFHLRGEWQTVFASPVGPPPQPDTT
jgi:hypothetical protein